MTGYHVEQQTTRVDVDALVGELFCLLVPILDRDNQPVEIPEGDTAGWSARAQVRRNPLACDVLHEFSTDLGNAEIVPGPEAKVRLSALASETALWQQWPDYTVGWDLDLTEPPTSGGDTYRLAAGRFRIIPEYTR